MGDQITLSEAIWTAIALLLMVAVLDRLLRVVRARRPRLSLTAPIVAAAGLRVAVATLIAAIPGLSGTRPVDDPASYHYALRLIHDSETYGALPGALVDHVHIWLLTLQSAVIGHDAGAFPLRITQITIAVCAIAIVAVAVNDLAGSTAGAVAAWLLALEPGSVFLSGFLLKEPLVALGEALVILGCVRMYLRRSPAPLGLMAAGVLLAAVIRPYLGFGLGAACILVLIHAALRHPAGRARTLTLVLATALAVTATALVVANADRIAHRLQVSQNANTHDASNLKLEPVDFTTFSGTAEAVPLRVFELLFRPYPWQASNLSQGLGVIGTLYAWALLFLTLFLVLRRPRTAFPRVAPLVYVAICITIAYAVTTGNAGTGFRYRTHVVIALAACVSVLAPRPGRLRLPALRPRGA